MTSAMCNALLGMICIEAVGTRNTGRLPGITAARAQHSDPRRGMMMNSSPETGHGLMP